MLITALKQSDPYRIILFGSHARGTATENSDIDMVVILDNDDVAKTYTERLCKKLSVNKLVRDINYKVALDILVYSKEEYRIVKNHGNYFIDEIEKTGKVVYEKQARQFFSLAQEVETRIRERLL
jgi:predicted nucleotidyltransferase